MDSTTTPSAAAEEEPRSPKTRARKRQRPLGDVTNLVPETPTPRNPSARLSLPSDTSTSASTSSFASATPVSKSRSAHVDEWSGFVGSEISTDYARRKVASRNPSADKAEAHSHVGTASCPPIGKAARNRSTRKASEAHDARPTSSSVPCHQAKKKHHPTMDKLSPEKPKLPKDFVWKQRAYFKEVDAFELAEMEASEIDLE